MQALLEKMNLRELRLAVIGVGAIVAFALFGALVMPKFKALQATNSALDVLREAALDRDELEQHIARQHELIETLRYSLHGDMANLPPRQVESYIIGRLQKISWNNNIELVSVQPTLGERIEVFQEMLFRVQLIGQYRDLFRWLWEARNDLGFIVVKELNLARNDDIDEEPLLKANLSLASYRRVE